MSSALVDVNVYSSPFMVETVKLDPSRRDVLGKRKIEVELFNLYLFPNCKPGLAFRLDAVDNERECVKFVDFANLLAYMSFNFSPFLAAFISFKYL